MIFAFGAFELDDVASEVRCGAEVVFMQPRVCGVLRYLIEHRGRVVSRQELLDALWEGRQLTSGTVPWTIAHARKALAAYAPAERFIETVRRRGYRFVAEVREGRATAARPDGALRARLAQQALEPLVGRDRTIDELRAGLAAAQGGRGAMFLLSGEAGIGKTRVALELAAHARALGIEPWSAHGTEGSSSPFSHLIQALGDACEDATLAEAQRTEARELLDGVQRSSAASFWLSDRISTFIAGAAEARPRYLMLDDLHHADEGTLRVLDLLMPRLRRSRLMILAAARDVVPSPQHAASTLSSRYRESTEVRLLSLAPAEVEACLRRALGDAASPSLARAVYAKTIGNPSFVREAAELLRARARAGAPLQPSEVALPQVARELMLARAAALAPIARGVLDLAAVAGGEIEVPLMIAAADCDVHDVLRAIEQAIDRHVVVPIRETPRYAFAHPLLRDVLYESLPAARRSELHARVGLALEALTVLEPRVDQLALHFHHALDQHERAARYARLAREQAARVR